MGKVNYISVVGVVSLFDGELEGDETDTHKCRSFYLLTTDEGEEYPLKFSSHEQATKVPINRKIALSISDSPDKNGDYLVSDAEKFYSYVFSSTTSEETSFAVADTGKPQVKIAIFRSINPTTLENKGGVEGDWYADQWELARKAAYDVWAFYAYHMGDIKDYEARGYCVVTEKIAGRSYYLEDVIKEYKQSDEIIFGQTNSWKEEFEKYNFSWHHAWSGSSSSYCGWGKVGYPGSMTYQSCSKGWKTMAHELGHNFGLRHSQSVSGEDPDFTVVEYGDGSCRMGNTSPQGFNSKQLMKLSGVPEHQVAEFGTEPKKVVLVPLELSEHAMHPNEIKVGVNSYWHFATRDYSTNAWTGDKLKPSSTIYKHSYALPGLPDSSQGSNRGKTQLWGTLKSGEEIAVGSGVFKESSYLNNSFDNFTKRVLSFEVDGVEAPEPEINMGFPEKVVGAYLDESHSGLWYNPVLDGQGFDVHIKNGKLVFVWYTYDRKVPVGSKPPQRFYIASCPLTDGIEEFDLVTTEGGTFSDPSKRTEKVIGKGQLYFFDEKNGVFLYDTEEHGYGAVELTKLLSSDEQDIRVGFWWNPARDGEGLTVTFVPPNTLANPTDKERCIGYLYTYDKPITLYHGQVPYSSQRWYNFDGFIETDEQGEYFDCKVLQAWNGQALTPKMKYNIEQIGVGRIRFVSQDKTCWVTFDFIERYNGTDRKKSIKMEKVF
jgi:hypothetical protein